jgi:hypothetical protein
MGLNPIVPAWGDFVNFPSHRGEGYISRGKPLTESRIRREKN